MPICLVTTQNKNKKSRSAALEFQDFPGISMVFQDLCLFPGLSRPKILNNKIPGLSRVCTNPAACFPQSLQTSKNLRKKLGVGISTGQISLLTCTEKGQIKENIVNITDRDMIRRRARVRVERRLLPVQTSR